MIDPAAILDLLSEKQTEVADLKRRNQELEHENARLRGMVEQPSGPPTQPA